jgi:ABC-2 type transport system permease protein
VKVRRAEVMAGFVDIVLAEFYSYTRFYKNNRSMLVFSFLWPYLVTLLLYGVGYLLGSPQVYAQRMGVGSAPLFILFASVAAMSSLYIIDDIAGYVLYNRWNGTLEYIMLTPAPTALQLLAASIPSTLLSPAILVASIIPAAVYLEGLRGLALTASLYLLVIVGMLPLAGLAVLAASLLLLAREESNIVSSLSALMLFVSGLFYPVKILPPVLQAIARLVPVTYVVSAAKLLASIGSGGWKLYTLLYSIAILTLAYNGTAILLLPHAERGVKRRGI